MSRTRHHGNKQKERLYGDDYRWLDEMPSAFVNEAMTRPQRRKVKKWIHDAMYEDPDELEPCPHGNKPKKYYY